MFHVSVFSYVPLREDQAEAVPVVFVLPEL
jgi:hypothetical protein